METGQATETCPLEKVRQNVDQVWNGKWALSLIGTGCSYIRRIPSAFWQLFWSWVYGPYILYKIRNIKDVHYWRLQVFLTVLSG